MDKHTFAKIDVRLFTFATAGVQPLALVVADARRPPSRVPLAGVPRTITGLVQHLRKQRHSLVQLQAAVGAILETGAKDRRWICRSCGCVSLYSAASFRFRYFDISANQSSVE